MQGNAYLETQVFGTLAGKNAAALAARSRLRQANQSQLHDEEKRIGKIEGSIDPEEITQTLQKIMWEKVGIVRNKNDLEKAIEGFRQLKKESAPMMSGNNIFAALETANLLATAEMIATSALAREESRGAHVRSDYPDTDDEKWLNHVCITNKEGKITTRIVPVVTREPQCYRISSTF